MIERSPPNVLVVDDAPDNLRVLSGLLRRRGYEARPVPTARLALQAARNDPPDLILLDVDLPDMDGYELCQALKADPQLADIPVIFVSANTQAADKTRAFASGGVDYVTKPFQLEEVEARVSAHLRIRRLQGEVEAHSQRLEALAHAQVRDMPNPQVATILALARLSEYRDRETGNHVLRIQRYCQALAMRLGEKDLIGAAIDDAFVTSIFHASALHDIGKVGIPDSILLKPGRLTPEELEVIKGHCALGAQILTTVAVDYPGNAIVQMGIEVARSHHERWDGTGYPDGLFAEATPLAARITMLADQYDALRNRRPHKPPFDHAKALAIITHGDALTSPLHFDPRVLTAFQSIAAHFDGIYQEFAG
jgi:putative two-component system response regulator